MRGIASDIDTVQGLVKKEFIIFVDMNFDSSASLEDLLAKFKRTLGWSDVYSNIRKHGGKLLVCTSLQPTLSGRGGSSEETWTFRKTGDYEVYKVPRLSEQEEDCFTRLQQRSVVIKKSQIIPYIESTRRSIPHFPTSWEDVDLTKYVQMGQLNLYLAGNEFGVLRHITLLRDGFGKNVSDDILMNSGFLASDVSYLHYLIMSCDAAGGKHDLVFHAEQAPVHIGPRSVFHYGLFSMSSSYKNALVDRMKQMVLLIQQQTPQQFIFLKFCVFLSLFSPKSTVGGELAARICGFDGPSLDRFDKLHFHLHSFIWADPTRSSLEFCVPVPTIAYIIASFDSVLNRPTDEKLQPHGYTNVEEFVIEFLNQQVEPLAELIAEGACDMQTSSLLHSYAKIFEEILWFEIIHPVDIMRARGKYQDSFLIMMLASNCHPKRQVFTGLYRAKGIFEKLCKIFSTCPNGSVFATKYAKFCIWMTNKIAFSNHQSSSSSSILFSEDEDFEVHEDDDEGRSRSSSPVPSAQDSSRASSRGPSSTASSHDPSAILKDALKALNFCPMTDMVLFSIGNVHKQKMRLLLQEVFGSGSSHEERNRQSIFSALQISTKVYMEAIHGSRFSFLNAMTSYCQVLCEYIHYVSKTLSSQPAAVQLMFCPEVLGPAGASIVSLLEGSVFKDHWQTILVWSKEDGMSLVQRVSNMLSSIQLDLKAKLKMASREQTGVSVRESRLRIFQQGRSTPTIVRELKMMMQSIILTGKVAGGGIVGGGGVAFRKPSYADLNPFTATTLITLSERGWVVREQPNRTCHELFFCALVLYEDLCRSLVLQQELFDSRMHALTDTLFSILFELQGLIQDAPNAAQLIFDELQSINLRRNTARKEAELRKSSKKKSQQSAADADSFKFSESTEKAIINQKLVPMSSIFQQAKLCQLLDLWKRFCSPKLSPDNIQYHHDLTPSLCWAAQLAFDIFLKKDLSRDTWNNYEQMVEEFKLFTHKSTSQKLILFSGLREDLPSFLHFRKIFNKVPVSASDLMLQQFRNGIKFEGIIAEDIDPLKRDYWHIRWYPVPVPPSHGTRYISLPLQRAQKQDLVASGFGVGHTVAFQLVIDASDKPFKPTSLPTSLGVDESFESGFHASDAPGSS
jgi:hypothetical protein